MLTINTHGNRVLTNLRKCMHNRFKQNARQLSPVLYTVLDVNT